VVLADVLVAAGFLVVFFVFRENTYTSATIEVEAGQKVISTGLYGLVRHPCTPGQGCWCSQRRWRWARGWGCPSPCC
jgi:protein-S-isoprenylcysteine O-methyltransferase Ste14